MLDIVQVNVETHVQEIVTLDAQVIVYLLAAGAVMEDALEVVLVTVADVAAAEDLVAQAAKDALEIAMEAALENAVLIAVKIPVEEDVAQHAPQTVNQDAQADAVQHVVLTVQEPQHNK